LTVLLAGLIVVVAGCGGRGPKSLVKGKVTLEGQPVAGTIIFIGSDNKEHPAPLAKGEYAIENPPSGEVTILVRGAGTGVAMPKGDLPMKDKGPKVEMPGTANMGVEPPAKYGQKEHGIKKTVKGSGTEKIDIELTR
jgi:hypothetical protein